MNESNLCVDNAASPVCIASLTRQSYGKLPSILLFATAALWGSVALAADFITLGSVKVPVDEFRAVDSAHVRISRGTFAEILPRDQAELKALEFALDDGGFRDSLTIKQAIELITVLSQRISSSKSDGLSAISARVVEIWVAHLGDQTDQSSIRESVREVMNSPDARTLALGVPFGRLLELGRGGVSLVAELSVRDPSILEIRSAVLSEVSQPLTAAALFEEVEQLGLNALVARDLERASNAGSALSLLRSGESGRALTIFLKRIEAAFIGTDATRAQSLAAILKGLTDARYRQALNSFVIDAVHSAARNALEQRDPSSALTALARLSLEQTTPGTHRLAIEALKAAAATDSVVSGAAFMSEPGVTDLLLQWAKVDPTIREQTTATVTAVGRKAAERGMLDLNLSALQQYLPLLTDRDRSVLLRARAVALARGGQREAAKLAVAAMPIRSWEDTLSFARAGLYGGLAANFYFVISVVLAIFLVGLRLWDRRSARRGESSDGGTSRFTDPTTNRSRVKTEHQGQALRSPSNPGAGGVSREGLPPRSTGDDRADRYEHPPTGGFNVSRVPALSPAAMEYRKLVATFGLGAEAPVRDIKQAYRSKVKSVHPDLNPNLSEADRQQFVTLTQSYERILELRKQLGIPDDLG